MSFSKTCHAADTCLKEDDAEKEIGTVANGWVVRLWTGSSKNVLMGCVRTVSLGQTKGLFLSMYRKFVKEWPVLYHGDVAEEVTARTEDDIEKWDGNTYIRVETGRTDGTGLGYAITARPCTWELCKFWMVREYGHTEPENDANDE